MHYYLRVEISRTIQVKLHVMGKLKYKGYELPNIKRTLK